MSKINKTFRNSFIILILVLTYIPLIFALIFSFNKPTDKGYVPTSWNGFTISNWTTFFNESRDIALINSVIIAISVILIVIPLSLITVFALWRQKNKLPETVVKTTYNIPLINPEVITAISLIITFSAMGITLSYKSEGMLRAIFGHVIISLPYCISIMYPASEKFNKNQFEASQDLGYSKIRSWFKLYLTHMIPSIIFSSTISIFFSFDDFIVTRLLSNTSTLGTKLYEGVFRTWGLVVGATLMIITLIGSVIFTIVKTKKTQKIKKSV
ncbi:ABC transporter permease [Mycoplasma phocimorsus]|uniref:ABC transporter permease n=1 Tax=Mycoplasma phocimorsus TaxID=3045839 RepID=UPI0024C0B68E|nr:ABC transporter permease subunit [Mycoplasma phocimorsus]MDJ1647490.1 ABC transporter permease subunit [Mycoplasma phocimorsus]